MPVNPQTSTIQELHFERSQAKCQRCQRTFEHLEFEEIDGLVQLRCGDVLITRTEMVCTHCGWVFHWDIRGKVLERMAVVYGELTTAIRLYMPE